MRNYPSGSFSFELFAIRTPFRLWDALFQAAVPIRLSERMCTPCPRESHAYGRPDNQCRKKSYSLYLPAKQTPTSLIKKTDK